MPKKDFQSRFRQKISLHKKTILNNRFFRWLLIFIIFLYVRFVFLTSKVKIHSLSAELKDIFSKNKTIIFANWHQDILLANFTAKILHRKYKSYQYNALASKHNDGQLIADIIKLFNKTNIIYGSTLKDSNSAKGINISSFRDLFKILRKDNQCFFITPDGPRGPAKKVSGHICNIASLAKAPIITIYCKTNRKFTLDSWDKFIIPLPFSKINIKFSDPILFNDKKEENINILQEIMLRKMIFRQKTSENNL